MKNPTAPKKIDPRLQPPSGRLLSLVQDQFIELIAAVKILGCGLVSEVDLTIHFKNQTGIHHLKEILSASTIRSRGIKTQRPNERILEGIQRQSIAFADCLMEFGEEKTQDIDLVVRYTNGTAFTYCLPAEEEEALLGDVDED